MFLIRGPAAVPRDPRSTHGPARRAPRAADALRQAAAVVALVVPLAGTSAAAADVVIYRCVAPDGAVLVQNGTRCPKGMREQKRVFAAPTTAPVVSADTPTASPTPPSGAQPGPVSAPGISSSAGTAGSDKAPTPTIDASAATRAPPALYTCLTAQAQRYFADSDDGVGCAPLEAVGLDGRSPSPAVACETVRNRCEAVAEADRCAAWAERRRVAEQALLFSPEQVDTARAEIARVDDALAGTSCPR